MGILKELFGGRHEQVMSQRQIEQTRANGGLPDIYIRSAEMEVEVSDPNYDALVAEPRTTLSPEARRRILYEEGMLRPEDL